MFEIYRRHTPMFALSQVKQTAQLLTTVLHFNDPAFAQSEIDIVDISETVRINENNAFVVRSPLDIETLILKLKENSIIRQLRNTQTLMEDIVKQMIVQLGVDSYYNTNNKAPTTKLDDILPRTTRDSKKPLMVFNAGPIDYDRLNLKWLTMDLPALWIEKSFMSSTKEVEAFFAISPELKIETSLNRYLPFECFADCAIGLIRL